MSEQKNQVSQNDGRLSIYQPTSWSHKFIESLDANFPEKMKDVIEKALMELSSDFENSSSLSIMQLLELIDSIERLGLSYRFQKFISQALEKIASINENNVEDEETKELHAVSLKFRLLRQHGYNVSEGASIF
nr:(E)-beta-ocimene synthase, chloroplastic-like [Tanacetum cinerariifolium]